jgi:hypothetical protein
VSDTALVPTEHIQSRIPVLRGVRVVLDRDLAALYGVTTKRLNEQVKRNARKFPEDFMFQLTREEARGLARLRSQNATLNAPAEYAVNAKNDRFIRLHPPRQRAWQKPNSDRPVRIGRTISPRGENSPPGVGRFGMPAEGGLASARAERLAPGVTTAGPLSLSLSLSLLPSFSLPPSPPPFFHFLPHSLSRTHNHITIHFA